MAVPARNSASPSGPAKRGAARQLAPGPAPAADGEAVAAQHARRVPPSSPRPRMPTRVARGGSAAGRSSSGARAARAAKTSSRRWYLSTRVSTNSLIMRVSRGVDQAAQGKVAAGSGRPAWRRRRHPASGSAAAWARGAIDPAVRARPGPRRSRRGSPASGQIRTSSSGMRRSSAWRQACASSSGLWNRSANRRVSNAPLSPPCRPLA